MRERERELTKCVHCSSFASAHPRSKVEVHKGYLLCIPGVVKSSGHTAEWERTGLFTFRHFKLRWSSEIKIRRTFRLPSRGHQPGSILAPRLRCSLKFSGSSFSLLHLPQSCIIASHPATAECSHGLGFTHCEKL